VLIAVLLLGCDGDSDKPTPQTEMTATAEKGSPEAIADAYALEKSGGQRKGCLTGSGPPEKRPGCIYSAAFGGCLDGLQGDNAQRKRDLREFPEPALQRVLNRAYRDCAEKR
jgi:hypothetical protein